MADLAPRPDLVVRPGVRIATGAPDGRAQWEEGEKDLLCQALSLIIW